MKQNYSIFSLQHLHITSAICINRLVIGLSVAVGDSVDVDVTDKEDVLLAVLGLADVTLLLVVGS